MPSITERLRFKSEGDKEKQTLKIVEVYSSSGSIISRKCYDKSEEVDIPKEFTYGKCCCKQSNEGGSSNSEDNTTSLFEAVTIPIHPVPVGVPISALPDTSFFALKFKGTGQVSVHDGLKLVGDIDVKGEAVLNLGVTQIHELTFRTKVGGITVTPVMYRKNSISTPLPSPPPPTPM